MFLCPNINPKAFENLFTPLRASFFIHPFPPLRLYELSVTPEDWKFYLTLLRAYEPVTAEKVWKCLTSIRFKLSRKSGRPSKFISCSYDCLVSSYLFLNCDGRQNTLALTLWAPHMIQVLQKRACLKDILHRECVCIYTIKELLHLSMWDIVFRLLPLCMCWFLSWRLPFVWYLLVFDCGAFFLKHMLQDASLFPSNVRTSITSSIVLVLFQTYFSLLAWALLKPAVWSPIACIYIDYAYSMDGVSGVTSDLYWTTASSVFFFSVGSSCVGWWSYNGFHTSSYMTPPFIGDHHGPFAEAALY